MLRGLIFVLSGLLCATVARGDAVIQTRAMQASTIVEYFIDEDGVRVELEIGLQDLAAFRNLLPDAVYERLGNEPRPFAERLVDFFGRDFIVATDDGDPKLGRILAMEPRDRILRDEISGEPLPLAEGEEPETVIFAELFYPFQSKPKTMTLGGPQVARAAQVGFVAYHANLPVNDFRYLSAAYVLDLDWEDPWYSSFRMRPLRRTYFAAMNGFLYVEPYEVRKEIIARPLDLQQWIDLGLEGKSTLPVGMQAELMRQVADFLRQHHTVVIDGEEVPPELARINFLRRTLRNSTVIDPPEELDLISATLGVIFVYPTDGLPENVTMEWDLFNERIERVPVASVDQAGPLPSVVTPDYPLLEWQNFLQNPILPTLIVTEPPPGALARSMLWIRWVLVVVSALALVLLGRGLRQRTPGTSNRAAGALALLILTAGAFWLARDARLTDDRAGELVAGLLHNVYRAFDFRDEEKIYDVLEKSVQGDLLTTIYLETQRGLELRNQGGARAKVKEIDLIELATSPGANGGFVASVTWNVAGSVGHWGHVHSRTNQYRANLDIEPVAGVWKLVNLDLIEESRL
jgi:hypothetical protein